MANYKKHPKQRKKSKTFAVTQRVLDDFTDHCEIKNLVPSHEVEKMIVEYNSKNI